MKRTVVDLISVGAMLWASWAGGSALDHLGGPALVAEIVTGAAFGPHGFKLIREQYLPALELLGDMGLLMLVFEGGLTMDIEQLKRTGAKAFGVAFTGTLLPVLMGWGLMTLLGFGPTEAFASGTALSATAIGFALRLLQDAKMVKTPKGLLITAAAMIDDVLSLVVLAMLAAVEDTLTAWSLLQPIIATLGVFVVGLLLRMVVRRAAHLPASSWPPSLLQAAERNTVAVLLTGFAMLTLLLAFAADELGSTHLLGVFMAGLTLSAVPGAVECWEGCGVTEAMLPWAVRLFFAASVGFSVPVQELFHARALRSGLLLTCAAFLGKYLSGWMAGGCLSWSGVVMSSQIGCAMIGRGELGFVIANDGLDEALLHDTSYSATVWALVLATLFGPVLFRWSLRFTTD